MTKLKAIIAVATLGLGLVSTAAADHGGSNNNNNNNVQNSVTRDRARLAGPAIQSVTPEGGADFRAESSTGRQRLNVEVEHVNLAAGTSLTVTLTHAGVTTTIGTITLSALQEGELELNSQDGATVPAVAAGDTVTVLNGLVAVVSGIFN